MKWWLALALLLGACSGVAVPADWHVQAGRADEDAPFDHAAFAAHKDILSGFDAAGDARRLRVGDRALYGVDSRSNDDPQCFLLLAEIVEAPAMRDGVELVWNGKFSLTTNKGVRYEHKARSESVRVRLTRFGLDGAAQQESEVVVAIDSLTFGLDRACAMCAGHTPETIEVDEAGARVLCMSLLSAMNLMEVVEKDELLASILWQTARAPSAMSVLTGLGITVAMYPVLDQATELRGFPGPDDPVWRLPLEIRANEEPALLVLVDAVAPRSPWNFAGLVGLTARRPGEEQARLVVRLLAARRSES